MHIRIIGAGLAGCEAALYLAAQGIPVELWEQKPAKFSPAHKSAGLAELVCSNSLKADRLDSASGLLKAEMRLLGSSLLPAAEQCRVAAGGALAVDRDLFSAAVTRLVETQPLITLHRGEVTALDGNAPDTLTLVATGPLTEGALAAEITRLTGEAALSFTMPPRPSSRPRASTPAKFSPPAATGAAARITGTARSTKRATRPLPKPCARPSARRCTRSTRPPRRRSRAAPKRPRPTPLPPGSSPHPPKHPHPAHPPPALPFRPPCTRAACPSR